LGEIVLNLKNSSRTQW